MRSLLCTRIRRPGPWKHWCPRAVRRYARRHLGGTGDDMDWLIVAIAAAVIVVIVATTVLAVRDRSHSPTLSDEAFDAELAALERTAGGRLR